jgi:hypothetical protein
VKVVHDDDRVKANVFGRVFENPDRLFLGQDVERVPGVVLTEEGELRPQEPGNGTIPACVNQEDVKPGRLIAERIGVRSRPQPEALLWLGTLLALMIHCSTSSHQSWLFSAYGLRNERISP